MRQVVLDTETTGLDPEQGHRIIEIGCVEIENRRLTTRRYHQYLQPDRQIDPGAYEVHGISNEYLADKPRFNDIIDDFLTFIAGAELIIHNAAFDIGFIDYELKRLSDQRYKNLASYCTITDTLKLARERHPGQKNNLDALCKRYNIDNSQRTLHGALLDAEILADVYLAMTGGQVSLQLDAIADTAQQATVKLAATVADLPTVNLSNEELAAHEKMLQFIRKESQTANCIWDNLPA